jgi:hypothetical protein
MSWDVSEGPENALDLGPDDRDDVDQPNDAPTLPADEEPGHEEHYDDDQEPDGRWAFSTEAGCWIYE